MAKKKPGGGAFRRRTLASLKSAGGQRIKRGGWVESGTSAEPTHTGRSTWFLGAGVLICAQGNRRLGFLLGSGQ